jgi:hypothetical protein
MDTMHEQAKIKGVAEEEAEEEVEEAVVEVEEVEEADRQAETIITTEVLIVDADAVEVEAVVEAVELPTDKTQADHPTAPCVLATTSLQ